MYEYEFPRPSVTADIVVIYREYNGIGFEYPPEVLLIRRKNDPFKGCWALPGGFMDIEESLAETAARELEEETGLKIDIRRLDLIGIYDEPNRDVRSRVISAAYIVELVEKPAVQAGDDAQEAEWFKIDEILDGQIQLAFDHTAIVKDAIYELEPY